MNKTRTEIFVSDIHGEYEGFSRALGIVPYDTIHMVGDVYDRGSAPERVMQLLMEQNDVDIVWGNHDVLWMGAALGQRGCICNIIRICARYGNLGILTDGYGIDLEPLFEFADEAYAQDPCVGYGLKFELPGADEDERLLNMRVQKAMSIIQYKAEAAHIAANPDFGLEPRNLLHLIDYGTGTIELGGVTHELKDKLFPTVDPNDPYALTVDEEELLQVLEEEFLDCDMLQEHIAFMCEKGALYRVCGDSLIFHACAPLNADGSLMEIDVSGGRYKGRALYDALQEQVYAAFRAEDPFARKRGRDMLWYLWLGEGSPLFAKSKMATFERYVIADKTTHKEEKNAFFKLFADPAPYRGILEDFGIDPDRGRIICGHVPVKAKDGESPVKAGGKVICIDGGYSPAYQGDTGLAGYLLVSGDALELYALQSEPDENGKLRYSKESII